MSIFTANDIVNLDQEQKNISQFEAFVQEMTQSWSQVSRETAINWVLEAAGVTCSDSGQTACEKIQLPVDKYEHEFDKILGNQGLKVA